MTKPPPSPARRNLKHLGVGLAALALGVGLPATTASAAPTDTDESELLSLLNDERASRSLVPLRLEGVLEAGAEDHAAAMAAANRLFHTSMGKTAPVGWARLGENVAMAEGATQLHQVLMASPTHRAAMLDPGFNVVGLGVEHGAGDSHWVSMKLADVAGASVAAAAGTEPGRWASPSGRVTAVGMSFHGDLASRALAAPVVGIVATPSNAGYWLVASDGGVFSFGDATYAGSAGGLRLAAPVVGMTAMPDGTGYWLAGADGGVFAFGQAPFLGSLAGKRLSAPIARINRTSNGGGYALYGADGARHGFGNAR